MFRKILFASAAMLAIALFAIAVLGIPDWIKNAIDLNDKYFNTVRTALGIFGGAVGLLILICVSPRFDAFVRNSFPILRGLLPIDNRSRPPVFQTLGLGSGPVPLSQFLDINITPLAQPNRHLTHFELVVENRGHPGDFFGKCKVTKRRPRRNYLDVLFTRPFTTLWLADSQVKECRLQTRQPETIRLGNASHSGSQNCFQLNEWQRGGEKNYDTEDVLDTEKVKWDLEIEIFRTDNVVSRPFKFVIAKRPAQPFSFKRSVL